MPRFGTPNFIEDIDLNAVYPLIDTRALFTGQWRFKRGQSLPRAGSRGSKKLEEAYQQLLKKEAWPVFEAWKAKARDEGIFEPKAVYGYFKIADLRSSNLQVAPIERALPPNNVADPPLAEKGATPTKILLQLVTLGPGVAERCAELFNAHQYTDYLYLHGLAVVTTEALAEYVHRLILKKLGIPFDETKPLPRGSRISPGYPVWPELKDQEVICRLLEAHRIGVTLTETYQLVPEYSTSAMIIIKS